MEQQAAGQECTFDADTDTDTDTDREQRMLAMMRTVLGSIVRDATPVMNERPVFSEATVAGIRDCFALISAREREIAEARGLRRARPHFTDDPSVPRPMRMPGRRD